MSSQIYSRYVPPAKKQKISAIAPTDIIQSASPAPTKTAPPSIKNDASSTYARYVPPSKAKPQAAIVDETISMPIIGSHPSKRNHEEVEAANTAPIPKKSKKEKLKSVDVGVVANAAGSEIKSKKLKSKTKDNGKEKEKVSKDGGSKEKKPAVTEDDDEEDSRHKKLMRKREKSLRKAEKLAKQEEEEKAATQPEDAVQEEEEIYDLGPLPQPDPIPEPLPQSASAALPTWISTPIRVSSTATAQFLDIGVPKEAVPILSSKGFAEAFAVQSAVLPLLLPGSSQQLGDVLVSAATGSGKTLAYVLPMIEDISKNMTTRLRGLIVMPTRELVIQAREVSETCASAFTAGSRRRVKIGTAVGSENFKSEQPSIMEQELVFDPEQYRENQKRLNSKWETSDQESDGEDEPLYTEESVSLLEDHVLRPVPKVDILICTPGRLVEHMKSTPGFSLQYLNWLVVDEADKLLDQSFQQWLPVVMGALQKERRTLQRRASHIRKVILSATLTRDIGQLSGLRLYRPKLVVLEGTSSDVSMEDSQVPHGHILPSLLVEAGIKVEDEGIKPLYLLEILRREDLITKVTASADDDDSDSDSPSEDSSDLSSDSSSDASSDADSSDGESAQKERPAISAPLSQSVPSNVTSPPGRGVLVFTKSNETAIRLGRLLALLEPKSSPTIATLTSTTRSSTRRTTIKAFENRKISILIASDLVSRGLDLPNLGHVINYDIPTSVASYVHRVGRTARAGKEGHAWTFFTPSEAWWFWNEIGRSGAVERKANTKVGRVNINAAQFDESQRDRYEAALETLRLETSTVTGKKSDK
ncbi:hypothetical protein HYALB_00004952 [Hymenoscyphus albidus]|uniref:ATP-dependent RNA helicase n=1 Tax=Hymenoscyphus albidus TaxID=595503 RepID=A0A9N9LGB5_9HELO|nr:hypothetical protein HYALB_00004952 [Hymenoscyphus albidus]